MSRNLIVTLADGNYFDQAKQLFSSVYQHSGWGGDYMLLAHQMEEKQLVWFREKGIIVKQIQNIGKKEFPSHPRAVLGKFHLFEKDLSEWKRIIYLDADISVTASLDWLLDLKDFWAVTDFHDMKLRGQFKTPGRDGFRPEEKQAHDQLSPQYDLDKVSFNSGVMAFDGNDVGEDQYRRLLELYNDYESITLHDQSILNLLFYERWNRLPLVFNNYFLYSRKPGSIRFEKCDGIVNHYIIDRIWKTKNQDHYPAWKRNLDMADSIDLDRRPNPTKVWDDRKIKEVSDKLETSTIRNHTISGKLLMAATSIDRDIGKIGKKIKKVSPGFYDKIRRKKREKDQ